MYRGDGLCGLDQFDKFSIVGKYPEPAVSSRQAGAHGDGAARGVEVESGRGSGGGGLKSRLSEGLSFIVINNCFVCS